VVHVIADSKKDDEPWLVDDWLCGTSKNQSLWQNWWITEPSHQDTTGSCAGVLTCLVVFMARKLQLIYFH